MSQHKHPASRKHLDTHRVAVRRMEQEAAGEIDALYAPARDACLAYLDILLGQMDQERQRLAQTQPQDEDDEEREPPVVSLSWLDGPAGRLISFTAHVERTMAEFATHAGAVITAAHERVTVDAADAAVHVLVARSNETTRDDVRTLPTGALSQMAGRAANGQPVASLLDGVGRQTANETARALRIAVGGGQRASVIRARVVLALDVARNRAQVVLTDSLWRVNADSMMAVYRANGRGA